VVKTPYRIRPLPMRITGWAVFAVGILVSIVNISMDIIDNDELLPGGHSPAYLVGGLVMAGAGLWWTGVMDAK